jgi:hypothetical protein
MTADGIGYAVPDPIDPHELVCFRVYVPKDSWYIGAFWGAYEYFTTWLAWARDPLHKGKEAAAVWRRAFDKARLEYETTKGVCEMNITGIRQDPLNPCNLQVEFDGNNNWTTVADLSKCGGGSGGCDCVYRFNGTNIQKIDDCSGEWVDAGPAYDPTIDTPIPKGLQLPAGQKCNAAANIAAEVERIADQLAQSQVDGFSLYSAASVVAGIVGLYGPPTFLITAFIAAIEAAFVAAGDSWEDAVDYDATEWLKQAIFAGIGEDGTYTLEGYAVTIQRATPEGLFAADGEELKKSVIFRLLLAMGPFTLSHFNTSHGITDADCTALEWSHVFNFEHLISTQWVRVQNYNVKWGVQNEAGWQTEHFNNATGYYTGILIGVGFQSTEIKSVRVVYNAEAGANDQPGAPAVSIFDLADVPPGLADAGAPLGSENVVDGTDQILTVTFDETVSGLALAMIVASDVDGTSPVGGSGTIKRITVSGVGLDPFA